jgi:hypothetical protein
LAQAPISGVVLGPDGRPLAGVSVDIVWATDFTIDVTDWFDPRSWPELGHVPTSVDSAVIPRNRLVTLSAPGAQAGKLTVQSGGILQLNPNAGLDMFGNLIVDGTLRAKSTSGNIAVTFHTSNALFVGGGDVPLDTDIGLWVTDNGQLDIEGIPKLGWTTAMIGLVVGATSISLADLPAGWAVGDQIVVTPTESPSVSGYSTHFDVATIAGISGFTVTLATGLTFDHPAVSLPNGTVRFAEVANLTRNILFQGTSANQSHIWIRSKGAHTLQYAMTRYMGVLNVLGRYPLHFHHGDDIGMAPGTTVTGWVDRDGGNHAFVPHVSSGISFSDCVSYNTQSNPYSWDEGDLTSNILWDHCLAAGVYTPPNQGFRLSGFKLGSGTGNIIRNSVACGVLGDKNASGIEWPEHANSPNTWDSHDCVTHNNLVDGVFVWQNDASLHYVDGFIIYNCNVGVEHGAYLNVYEYDGVIIKNCPASGGAGGLFNLYSNSGALRHLRIHDSFFDGAGVTQDGIYIGSHTQAPAQSTRLENLTFSNLTRAAISVFDATQFGSYTSVEMVNPVLNGVNALWFDANAQPNSKITISGSDPGIPPGGPWEVHPAGFASGTFYAPWNAKIISLASGHLTLLQTAPIAQGNAAWLDFSDDSNAIFLANEESAESALKINTTSVASPGVLASNGAINFAWAVAQKGGFVPYSTSLNDQQMSIHPTTMAILATANGNRCHAIATDGAFAFVGREGTNPGQLVVLNKADLSVAFTVTHSTDAFGAIYGMAYDAATKILALGVNSKDKDGNPVAGAVGGAYLVDCSPLPTNPPVFKSRIAGVSSDLTINGTKLYRHQKGADHSDNVLEKWSIANLTNPVLLTPVYTAPTEVPAGVGQGVSPSFGQMRTNTAGTRLYVNFSNLTTNDGLPVKNWRAGIAMFDVTGNTPAPLNNGGGSQSGSLRGVLEFLGPFGYWAQPTGAAISPDGTKFAVSFFDFGVQLLGLSGDTFTVGGKIATAGEGHDIHLDGNLKRWVWAKQSLQPFNADGTVDTTDSAVGDGVVQIEGQWRPFRDGLWVAVQPRNGFTSALDLNNTATSFIKQLSLGVGQAWDAWYDSLTDILHFGLEPGFSTYLVGPAVAGVYTLTPKGSLSGFDALLVPPTFQYQALVGRVGGSLAGTQFYKMTVVDSSGRESSDINPDPYVPNGDDTNEQSIVLSGGNSAVILPINDIGIPHYRIYRGAASNGENVFYALYYGQAGSDSGGPFPGDPGPKTLPAGVTFVLNDEYIDITNPVPSNQSGIIWRCTTSGDRTTSVWTSLGRVASGRTITFLDNGYAGTAGTVPALPQARGTYAIIRNMAQVTLTINNRQYVYGLGERCGFVAIDVTNPTAPFVAWQDLSFAPFNMSGNNLGLVYAQGRFYVGAGARGVRIYNPATLTYGTSGSPTLILPGQTSPATGVLQGPNGNYWTTWLELWTPPPLTAPLLMVTTYNGQVPAPQKDGFAAYDLGTNVDNPTLADSHFPPPFGESGWRARAIGGNYYQVTLYGFNVWGWT